MLVRRRSKERKSTRLLKKSGPGSQRAVSGQHVCLGRRLRRPQNGRMDVDFSRLIETRRYSTFSTVSSRNATSSRNTLRRRLTGRSQHASRRVWFCVGSQRVMLGVNGDATADGDGADRRDSCALGSAQAVDGPRYDVPPDSRAARTPRPGTASSSGRPATHELPGRRDSCAPTPRGRRADAATCAPVQLPDPLLAQRRTASLRQPPPLLSGASSCASTGWCDHDRRLRARVEAVGVRRV